ncbi:MAG: vWA domain-containing protein [Planctomycetota bacterium]
MRRALPDAAAAVGTLLVAASAWLYWPKEREGDATSDPPLRVVLVDTSASAVWRRSDWSERARAILREQSESAERAGERLAVVLFGRDVQRIYGPAAASAFDDSIELPGPFGATGNHGAWLAAGRASRLADGLRVAGEFAAKLPRSATRVVLVGDGTYTGTDPRPALRQLASHGARLERADLPPADREEIVPGALDLPDEAEVGAPITASFDVFYAPGAGARKNHVTLDGYGGLIQLPVPESLVPDEDGYLRWHVRTEVGRARAGWNPVRISGRRSVPVVSDLVPDISSAGVVRGAGARLVALVPGDRRPHDFPLPTGDGLEASWVQPEELAAGLDRFDAVVTFDLPFSELPMPIVRSFVRRGGGWLALVGEKSLSSFVAGTAPDFLPLLPPEENPEPRDVVFVVDRSGSMSGQRSENVRRAVFALMDEALPSDSVELRWFASTLSPAIHLVGPGDSKLPVDREEARRRAADQLFATQIGGGPTGLLRALGELAGARARLKRESLVFLLSDGLENLDPDPFATATSVLDRLRAARARLVVIAAGEESDRALLSKLVAPGQQLESVSSLLDSSSSTQLRALFWRELNLERVREGDRLRILPAQATGALKTEILAAMKPESAQSWPTLASYVRARVSPGAAALWTSETGEPLLAIQRVGLGTSAACAFSLGHGLQLPAERPFAFGELLTPLLRTLARGGRSERTRVRVEGEDLLVDSLPEDAPADLEARVFGAYAEEGDPPTAVIPLAPAIEGGDPRRDRRGRWPSSATELLSVLWDEHDLGRVTRSFGSARAPRVEIRAAGKAEASWTPIHLALAPPRAVEFVLPRPRIPPFETIAVDRPQSGSSRPSPHSSAPWVLLSGLLLLAGAGFAGTFSRSVR